MNETKNKIMVVNSDAGYTMPLELVYAGQTFVVTW